MKRLVVVLLAIAALAAPAAASAHPLGNFTTNRYSELQLAGDRLYVLYVLDLAEIPTYQARREVARTGRNAYAARIARMLPARIRLTVDGRARPLAMLSHRLEFPRGAAGLTTTRLEVVYGAGAVTGTSRLAYRDANFPGRLGWKEIVVRARDGARLTASTAPDRSVTRRLRTYPTESLSSPLAVTAAAARLEPGAAAGAAPALGGAPAGETAKKESRFEALVSTDDLGLGFVLVSLAAAMFWGAAHALTPGHGKALVAAYMVGTRGNARHALLLGLTVTVTHTIGVFALGLVTLALSEFIVPEDLYPWLNLVSALLVVAVGVTVLRYRLRGWLRRRDPRGHDHHQGHDHHHGHGHDHHHGPGGHSHVPEPGSGLRGLLAVGVSGGLLPCPTALVVLLAAISLHRVAYGLVLIVAFSVGLASVVTAIGLLAVAARRTFRRMSFDGPLVRALPAVSALVILGVGIAMTVRSLPSVT